VTLDEISREKRYVEADLLERDYILSVFDKCVQVRPGWSPKRMVNDQRWDRKDREGPHADPSGDPKRSGLGSS
jgi:hypothetical protein